MKKVDKQKERLERLEHRKKQRIQKVSEFSAHNGIRDIPVIMMFATMRLNSRICRLRKIIAAKEQNSRR